MANRLLDANNKLFNHIVVAIFTLVLFFVLVKSGVSQAASAAWISFFLLFLTLIIGPLMQLIKPSSVVLPWGLPWSWRGEFGIWFTLFAFFHILFILHGANWQVVSYFQNMNASNLAGLVAFFWAVVLSATSFSRVIRFLGIESWRWLHNFAYVIFYMAGIHVIHHAFLRAGRPSDWKHWSYLFMMVVIMVLQFAAFVKVVAVKRKSALLEQSANKEIENNNQ